MLEVSYIQGRAAHLLRQAVGVAIVVASLAGLGGCQGSGAIGSGEGLFHDLEGGAVAAQRPPPPGVDDPYPNLGTIPKRPAAPDIVAEQKLADQLATQRDQASQAAAASPLTPRAAPPPLPKPTPPDPNANRVTVDAAATPPPKPQPAPQPATQADTKAASAPGPAGDTPTLASVPAVPTAVVAGPLPTLAAAPPALPTGLGPLPSPPPAPVTTASASAPATTPSPATPAAAPAPAKPLLDRLFSNAVVPIPTGDTAIKIAAPPVTASVTVVFTPGSAELPPSANLNLRRFALAHKGVPVTITGGGDDVLPGSDPQSRALDLALRRAQAIATALGVAGIPAANLRVRAEAAGHGGSVTL
jgi:outer membrane protein OmpA-like peptidoglycan-associated protein